MRITLDTNIWLDLLLFENLETQALAAALQALGVGHAAVNTAGLKELSHQLTPSRWPAALQERAAAAQAPLKQEALAGFVLVPCEAASGLRQPACRDPDDQHFLELAAASGSFALLTKDRDLLACKRFYSAQLAQAPEILSALRGRVLSPDSLRVALI
jgi:uncharacterized protein